MSLLWKKWEIGEYVRIMSTLEYIGSQLEKQVEKVSIFLRIGQKICKSNYRESCVGALTSNE